MQLYLCYSNVSMNFRGFANFLFVCWSWWTRVHSEHNFVLSVNVKVTQIAPMQEAATGWWWTKATYMCWVATTLMLLTLMLKMKRSSDDESLSRSDGCFFFFFCKVYVQYECDRNGKKITRMKEHLIWMQPDHLMGIPCSEQSNFYASSELYASC